MYTLGRFHNGQHLVLDDRARRVHCAIVGATGTGKSTLLDSLMRDDLHSGRGFCLVDPHGDLAEGIAAAVPPHRIGDVLYFDPTDPTHAVGFNPLSDPGDAPVVTANIVSSFKHVWGESWGPRMEYILGNAIRLLLSSPSETLVSLPLLLIDRTYRNRLLAQCTDPAIRTYWTVEYEGYNDRLRSDAIAPIQNKAGVFTNNPLLRDVIGQRSTIDFDRIINGKGILIANLSKRMGEEPSHLLGAFLVTAIAQAAQRRATIPEESRRDFTLYVDEFQNFATDTFAAILSEMRKWRLNLVVANQFMGQVPNVLRQSILGNVGTLVAFRIGAEDAPMIASQLGSKNPPNLTNTPDHHAWVKTFLGGSPIEPQYLSMLPPQAKTGNSLPAVIARTRASHARLRSSVEASIAKLFPSPEPKKRRRSKKWKVDS